MDGGLTQVDAIVRCMVTFPDGDHAVHEVLVCDSFDVALWSVPYMRCFGYRHVLAEKGEHSFMLTPGGAQVRIPTDPDRIYAPPRPPTAAEFATPPPPPGRQGWH